MFPSLQGPHKCIKLFVIGGYMALNERGGELFKKDFRRLLTLE